MKNSTKILLMAGLVIFHFGSYFLVNHIYEMIPNLEFLNLETRLDKTIPYWPWTWPVYYFGFVYSALWAAYVAWKLPDKLFLSCCYAYLGMLLTGTLIHLFFPSKAPWPEAFGLVQNFFKESLSVRPYACFPSMHVATAVFPACIALYVLKSKAVKTVSLLLAVLISISTVTAKEHYILDVLSGAALALAIISVWQTLGGRFLGRRTFG